MEEKVQKAAVSVATAFDRRRFLHRAGQSLFYAFAFSLARGASLAFGHESCSQPTGPCCPTKCGPSPCCGTSCSTNGCSCNGTTCLSPCSRPGTWGGHGCWSCTDQIQCKTTTCCDCDNSSGVRCICAKVQGICLNGGNGEVLWENGGPVAATSGTAA